MFYMNNLLLLSVSSVSCKSNAEIGNEETLDVLGTAGGINNNCEAGLIVGEVEKLVLGIEVESTSCKESKQVRTLNNAFKIKD